MLIMSCSNRHVSYKDRLPYCADRRSVGDQRLYNQASQTQVLSRLLLQCILIDLHDCSRPCELNLRVLEVLDIPQQSSVQAYAYTTNQNWLVHHR